MPCIWGTHNNSQLFMNVAIIDASQINVAQSGPVNSSPIAAPPLFKALVDTGAQKTMISDHVANTLKLPIVGKYL